MQDGNERSYTTKPTGWGLIQVGTRVLEEREKQIRIEFREKKPWSRRVGGGSKVTSQGITFSKTNSFWERRRALTIRRTEYGGGGGEGRI